MNSNEVKSAFGFSNLKQANLKAKADVTPCSFRNSAKSNWLLEELDWNLHSPGNLKDWDGLLNWFMSYVDKNPRALKDDYIYSWHRAATRVNGPNGRTITFS